VVARAGRGVTSRFVLIGHQHCLMINRFSGRKYAGLAD